jgi:hypothetical protein
MWRRNAALAGSCAAPRACLLIALDSSICNLPPLRLFESLVPRRRRLPAGEPASQPDSRRAARRGSAGGRLGAAAGGGGVAGRSALPLQCAQAAQRPR